MNVIQIINKVSVDDLNEAYLRLYPDQVDWLKGFPQFREDLNRAITVTGDSLVVEFLKEPDYTDVVGVDLDGQSFALDFTSWGEWKGLEVRSDLPLAEQAAHIFEEMSWYGGQEMTEAARAIVEDAMEGVERALETGDFTPFDDLLRDDPKSDI